MFAYKRSRYWLESFIGYSEKLACYFEGLCRRRGNKALIPYILWVYADEAKQRGESLRTEFLHGGEPTKGMWLAFEESLVKVITLHLAAYSCLEVPIGLSKYGRNPEYLRFLVHNLEVFARRYPAEEISRALWCRIGAVIRVANGLIAIIDGCRKPTEEEWERVEMALVQALVLFPVLREVGQAERRRV